MTGRALRKQAGRMGIIGIIALAVVGYGGYVASDAISAHWQWYKIRRETLDIARFSRGKGEPKIAADVMQAAKALGVENITAPTISREVHTDAKTEIKFRYNREIDYKQFGKKTKEFKVEVFQGMPMVEGAM